MAKDLKRRIVAEFSAKNRAKGVMSGFRRDMDTTGRALRRMAMGALAVAGIGGLGYMLKKQMEVIDSTAKLSDRLGVTTEKLIGLQHAASITGTDAETLNKSLEIFVRRLGEMTQGSGEAKRGLDMLGLTAEQLIRMSPAEAFGLAADKLKLLDTQAEKTAAAYFLFGRAGSKMLNMLEVGSEGLREFQKEAERLGLTFSRFDASQVEAANDALTRARAVLTGLFRQATIELAPYIEVLADKFVDVSTAGEGMGANVSKVFEMMTQGAVAFGSTIQMVGIRHKQLNALVLSGMAKYFEVLEKVDFLPVFKGMEYLFKRQYGVGFGEFAAALRESATDWKKELADLEKETKQRSTAIEKFFNDLRNKAAGQQAAIAGISPANESSLLGPAPEPKERKSALEGVIRYTAALEKEIEIAKRVAQGHQYAAKMIGLENEFKKAGIEGTSSATATMGAYIKRLEELGRLQETAAAEAKGRADARERELEKIRLEEQRWDDVARAMEGSFANAFEAMAFEARNFGDVMKIVAREISMEMARIMVFRPAAQELAGWFRPALSGFFGGLFGGGGGGSMTPAASATMARYQHGGVVTSPHLAMVGEVPEAIVPLSGGRSIPVEMKSSGSGSSSRGEVTINVSNVPETYEISKAEEYMLGDERIINVIMQKIQTHGPLRRSIKQASRG